MPQPLISTIQRDAFIRTLMQVVGSAAGTYLIQKGVLSQDQVTFIAANAAGAAAIVMALGAWAWTIVSRKQANMVAAVAQMPEVSKVEMTQTDGGPALAAAVSAFPAVINSPAALVTVATK